MSLSPKQRVQKRVTDLVGSLLGLIVLAPCIGVIAVAIRVSMGRPVLFTQQRPGLNGRAFRMWKFRTMRGAVDTDGKLLSDEQRLTTFGRFLRSTSLDELPELVNVVRGEMSLVGPRPLLMEYLGRYTPEQARRHLVKPGITGWAQVNGRNAISWEERFALDISYVDHQTFWLDCKILGMTVCKVLRRADISAAGHATMPKFQGNMGKEKRAA